MRLTHLVTPAEAGRTVRDLLRRGEQVSYTALQKAKWHGVLSLNGQPCHTDARCVAGDVLVMALAEADPVFVPRPYPLEIPVVWQDTELMIVEKPAPLAVQCSERQPDNTLENALYAQLGCPPGFIYRPVNRLDKGTSGLMAVALNAHAQQLMQRLLHTPAFERVYLAVTEGEPPREAGVIDLPIGKEDAASVKRVIDPAGKPAVTHYRLLRRGRGRCLLQLRLETGRTHQIRLHLAALGCAVCGDFLYGRELAELPGRFALHAAGLRFQHPRTGQIHSLVSPLPRPLAALLG